MKISEKQLSDIRKKHPKKTIAFCSGGFDLTHAGHAVFFEDCKKQADILVVGVASDAVRIKERGAARAPILSEQLRAYMVDSLKPVDYTFVLTESAKSGEHPAAPLAAIFKKLHPDAWVVNKNAYDIPYRQKLADQLDVKLVALPRVCSPKFEDVSTINIIDKIRGAR